MSSSLVRSVAWLAGVSGPAIAAAGCSLVLDFSDRAIPADAAADAPFSAAECAFGEPNDSPATATVLALTDVGPAASCPGGADDHDFYKLTVPPGSASVSVRITFASSDGDLDLRLYDRTGATTLSRSSGFGDQEQIVCPGASPACSPLAPDDYLFEVFPALAGAGNRYDIALAITPM